MVPIVAKSVVPKGKKNVLVNFPYRADLVAAVKEIPGRKFDLVKKCWEVPLSVDSCLQFVDFCLAYDFDLPDEVADKLLLLVDEAKARETTRAANKEQSGAYAATLEVPDLRGELRPFQKAGVAYAVRNKRVLLGDDMGLGKTVSSMCAVHYLRAYPCLVVCPAAVKFNWEKEYIKWLPSVSTTVLDKSNKNPDFTAPVVIVNYDQLAKYADELAAIGFAGLIVDESHYLKSSKTLRFKNLKALVKEIDVRLLLTGTPVVNMPYDLIAQLDLLGVLPQFGGSWKFINRYCGAEKTAFGMNVKGASNLNELHEKLREICYIRRLKTEVAKELPAKSRTVLPVTLSNASEYRKAEENVLRWLADKATSDVQFREGLEGLGKLERDKAIFDRRQEAINKGAGAEQLVKMNALLTLSGAGKMAAAIEWIENFLLSGEKLVIFAVHTAIVNALADHFHAPRIMGETSLTQREKAKEHFCQDPSCRLLVLNIQAGGTGIDGLQHVCSNALFLEQGWTPAVHNQAEDRLNRMGQTVGTMNYYMLAKDSIDMDIYRLIDVKRNMADAVIDGKEIADEKSVMQQLMAGLQSKQKQLSF